MKQSGLKTRAIHRSKIIASYLIAFLISLPFLYIISLVDNPYFRLGIAIMVLSGLKWLPSIIKEGILDSSMEGSVSDRIRVLVEDRIKRSRKD